MKNSDGEIRSGKWQPYDLKFLVGTQVLSNMLELFNQSIFQRTNKLIEYFHLI